MSSTRSLRNRSSPATFAESTPPIQETIELQQPGNGVARQARLDHWVEPNVRSGISSFEDTKGLERVGVLEHMQPLGTGPNMRLLQKLKVTGFRPSPSARATPMYSEGVASPSIGPSRDEVSSPMIDPELLLDTPPPQPQSLAPPSHVEPEPQPPLQPYHQDQETAAAQSNSVMSPPRGRPVKRDVEEMKVYPDDMDYSPTQSNTDRPSRASPRISTPQEQLKGERFRGFLQNAISRAARDGKTDVVEGLTSVLEASDRDEVITALENISKYKGNVRLEQFKVFKHYVKKGVRKHRRLSQQNEPDILQQSLTNSRLNTHSSNFQADGKGQSSAGIIFTPSTAVKSPLTLRTNHMESSDKYLPIKLTLHSPTLTENALSDQIPQHKAFDPSRRPTPRKRRSSSTSSLSSAISVSSSYGHAAEQARELGTLNQAAESWPSNAVASRQAPARAASGRTTRLSGMDPQPNQSNFETQFSKILNTTSKEASNKRQKLSSQYPVLSETDTEEVKQRQKEFEDAAEKGYNYRPVPTVKERPDIESVNSRPVQRQQAPWREGPPPPRIHPNSLTHSMKADVFSPATSEFPVTNGTGRKRDYDEYTRDDSSRLSSPAPSLPASESPPALFKVRASSTRASTPRAAKTAMPAKTRKTPRTMISPRKTKNGASNATGATRAGITKDSVMANGANANGEKEENEDECRACGDAGLLLLCEGCPNSFHGDCLEPPVSSDEIEGDWYCPECEARRRPQTATSEDGYKLMKPMVDHVSDAYPRVYALPPEIRSYFEGVKTGDDGEYIELAAPPTNKKGAPRTDNSGAIKPPNYKDMRDKHGMLRRCYRCGLGTDGEREMMPCDYCPHEWHLDCLWPPASVIPKRFGPDGKAPPSWRCPLHIERDLLECGRVQGTEVGQLGRNPRLRRPKNAVSVLQSLAKPAPTNNGIIDVQLEPEQPDFNVKTVEMRGDVVKIPEKKVILDFIKKARWDYYYDMHYPIEKGFEPHQFHAQSWLPNNARFRDPDVPRPATQSDTADDPLDDIQAPERSNLHWFRRESSSCMSSVPVSDVAEVGNNARQRLYMKPFIEQQTVQNLVELSGASERASTLPNLIDHLIADAPEDVTRSIQLSELEQLDLLQKLVEERRKTVTASINGHATAPTTSDQNQPTKTKLNGSLNNEKD